MADVNRHVKWPEWAMAVEVRGSTVIEMGDLLFLDRADGLRNNGTSTATQTAYPFATAGGTTKTLVSNQNLAADNFVGVALYDSKSGDTESLAVATSGHFRFPLRSARTFRTNQVVMPAGSGTSLDNQKISIWASGSTYPLGYATRGKTRGGSVTFLLRPAVVSHGGKITFPL